MADVSESKPKVTLHWLNTSRAQRIVWLLEECKGLDWDIKVYKRQSNMLAPPALKDIHPLGKSPAVTVQTANSKEPLVLAESAAIVEYMIHYFAPHLAPKRYQEGKENQVGGETEHWVRYRFFMHYAEGSLMTMMVLALVVDQIRDRSPFFAKPITGEIVRRVYAQFLGGALTGHLEFLESQLATSPDGGKYLCGKDITGADIMLSYPLMAGREKIPASKYPKLSAYTDLLLENEQYKNSTVRLEKLTGEPFEGAIPR